MESILNKYDEIFFDKERIGLLIDELLFSGSILTLKALDAVLCNYIHVRVRQSSNVAPMSIPIVIKLDSVNLGSADEDYFFKRVEYVCSELKLDAITQKANHKIYVELY